MTDDPQDVAETLDEDRIDDAGAGGIDFSSDGPYAVEEELVTEPIVDSVASRDDRLMPEPDAVTEEELVQETDLSEQLIADEVSLVGDERDLSAEEAALHVSDEP